MRGEREGCLQSFYCEGLTAACNGVFLSLGSLTTMTAWDSIMYVHVTGYVAMGLGCAAGAQHWNLVSQPLHVLSGWRCHR